MTIRQFARLCGCNPQTLRYYDHEDLLKPVKVDQWSGYRFYEEEQALDFVKIKNLQKAGFTIEEIRALLDKDSLTIYRAFDEKIAEHEKRLQEIKAIQQSYQTEMKRIKERIEEAKEKITGVMKEYDAMEEFGIDAEQYRAILRDVEGFMDAAAASAPNLPGLVELLGNGGAAKTPRHDALRDPNYALVYEKHGWEHVKDFLAEFSDLEDGGEYALRFRLDRLGEEEGMAFASTMLNVLLARNPGKKKTLTCDCDSSEDGKNHFWLLKKK